MGTQHFSEEAVIALVWIKKLYKASGEGFDGLSIGERIIQFDATSVNDSRSEYDNKRFNKGLGDLVELNILAEDAEETFILTTNGKAVLMALAPLENLDYDIIEVVMNGTIKGADFIKKHGKNITDIVLRVLGK